MPRSIKSNNKDVICWVKAPDIKKRISKLIKDLHLNWIKEKRLYCVRSKNAKTRAIARIWGLGRIWQQTLDLSPAYIIEVVAEKFDKLAPKEQNKVLMHEIVHIPKNFSGSLLPHFRKGKHSFKRKVDALIDQYFVSHQE